MAGAEGALSADEERELEALVWEARAWIAGAAERASPSAVASASILAALNAYEDTFGTEALAAMLCEMAAAAADKVAAGPPSAERH